ncbi:MAG: ribonuclease E/G, partial [Oceanicaulis sp.]|nr:ribonuclease E/G [Oceanicaulis sp.]
ICWERFGVDSVETCALAALRRLDAEGQAKRGGRLALLAGKEVHAWLENDPIGWSKAMKSRLGDRFELVLDEAKGARDFEVRPL